MNKSIEMISLSELIEQIKADLLAPVDPNSERNPLFFIDAVEVTAQVVVQRNEAEGGKAGLSLAVLGLKADAGIDSKTTVGSELTQGITIKLSPLLGKADYLARLAPEQRQGLDEAAARAIVRGGTRGSGERA
jgi:hypothetical protein